MEPTSLRFTVQGKQAVTVDGRYAYVWGGSAPLAVGDRVLLPGTALTPDWEGVVTDLGSTYAGYHARVLDRA